MDLGKKLRKGITIGMIALGTAALSYNCAGPKKIGEEKQFLSDQEKEKYAIIMSGNSDFRHPKSISFADSILSKNGYKTYIFDDTINRDYNVTGITTRKNLKNFFDTLKTKKDDLFLLYVTGHGNRDTTKNDTISTIDVPKGEPLKPSTFKNYLSNIDASNKVLLFTQCYSGDFGKKLGKENTIAISTSSENKSSYGTHFGNNFFKSLNSKAADVNKDKKISVLEASSYAYEKDIHSPLKVSYEAELLRKDRKNFLSNSPKIHNIINQPRVNHENLNPKKVYLNNFK